MEENEFEEENVDVRASVAQYEEMVTNHQSQFFDVNIFEHIVSYYEQHEQWKKAIRALDHAIEQHPYSSFFLIRKASLLIYYRKFNAVLELLDKAESIDPFDSTIYILRSDVYAGKRQYVQAIKILEEGIEKFNDPIDKEELLLELADVYEDCDEYENVFDSLKKVLEINHDNEEALSRMWYSVELADKYEESISLHQEIIEKNPYSYLAWHNLGNAFYNLDMYEKAIESYEFVTAINESCDLAYRDCGDAYFQLKQYHKAIEQFQRAIEFSKPYEELFFSVGYCLEKLKDYNKARSYYRKAITIDPKYSEAYFRIGETFKREKLWENAIHFYKKSLRILPDSATYLMAMANAFYNLGEIEPFIFACQSVMALNAKLKTKTDYEKLAGFLIDLGCTEDALNLVDFAAFEKGSVGSYAYLRSICYFKFGKRKEAIAWLEDGLSNHYAKHKLLFRFAPELKGDPSIAFIIEQYK